MPTDSHQAAKYSPDADDEGVRSEGIEPSAVARDIAKFKETVMRVAQERERLPQPMFWSLMRNRLADIRRQKELDRLLSKVLDGGDV